MFFCAFWPTRQRHKRGQARKSTRTFRFPAIGRTTVLLLGSPSARCVDAIGWNRSRRVHLCAEAVLARVPLRPVHKRQRAASGGTCVRVSRGRSRGELGRSSRPVRPRAKPEKTPQTEAATAEGKDFVLLRCLVCFSCGNPPTRFGGRRAAEAASPFARLFFAENGVIALLFLARPRLRDTEKTLSEGLPGSLRKPPSLPGRGRPPSPSCFYKPRGVSDAIWPRGRTRKDGKGVTGAVRQAGFFGCERKVPRPPAKRSGAFCFVSRAGCLDTVSAGRRHARPRG